MTLEPTLSREYYLSPDLFAREKDRIFTQEWFCVGREEEVPGPGDYLLLDLAGESVLLVRDAGRRPPRPLQCLPPSRLAAGARRRPEAPGRRRHGDRRDRHLHARASSAPITPGPTTSTVSCAPHRSSRRATASARRSSRCTGSAVDRSGADSSSSTWQATSGHPAARRQLGGAVERSLPLPSRRAAERPADHLPRGCQLEGHPRELQRVLPLRARAPRALPGGAGVQAEGRAWTSTGTGACLTRRGLDLHHDRHHESAPLRGAQRRRAGAAQGRADLSQPDGLALRRPCRRFFALAARPGEHHRHLRFPLSPRGNRSARTSTRWMRSSSGTSPTGRTG